MRYCGSCWAAVGPGLRFCTSCGAPLPAGATAPPAGSPPSDSVFARPAPPVGPAAEVPPPPSDSVFASSPPAPPQSPPWGAAPSPVRREAPWAGAHPATGQGRRRPLVVGGVVLAALFAIGGGYVVADRTLGGDVATASQEGLAGDSTGDGAAPSPSGRAGDDALRPRSVTATCQAPPGVDAANLPVTYGPANTLDGFGGTAWRCAGSAVGQQLVFDFGRPVTLSSVGLVPGYDKIDPVDGTDRFGENRTVTGVTWRFDGGDDHRQEIPAPTRALAESPLRTPVTTTRVVLEIARTGNDGAIRDFTTISDIAFTGSG